MSDAAAPAKKHGLFRTLLVGVLGLSGGAVATYTTAVVEKIAKPPLPIANFAATADGLTVTCQNQASGDTGWWDFGDGSPLESFAADQPTVSHTYAKPGTYSVKLVVRNFTADENDRAVTVDAAPAAAGAAGAPQITGFAVQPLTPGAVAPATFRVTAEVQNAEHCVWDFGDGRVEVGDGGKIDRTVTFDNPGPVTVQLVAHNGKVAARQAATVRVEAPPAGSLTAVLKVTDAGSRAERLTRQLTVAVPAPKDKAGPAFSKPIAARPGFTLVEVVSAKADVPGVKNLRVAVAPDKKSATLSGEWANPKAGKAGGSDALIPLRLTEERTVSRPPAVATVSAPMPPLNAAGKTAASVTLPAPPAQLDGMSRTVRVELRQTAANGKSVVIAEGDLTGRGPVPIPARQYVSLPTPPVTTASYEVDAVKIAFEVRPASGVVPAGGP